MRFMVQVNNKIRHKAIQELIDICNERCQEASMNGLRQKNGKSSATATPEITPLWSVAPSYMDVMCSNSHTLQHQRLL